MSTSDAAIPFSEDIVSGEWYRDDDGRTRVVVCACGAPVFYRGAIHSRLVVPENGTALCKRCRRMVRVPVVFADPSPQSAQTVLLGVAGTI